MTEQGRYRPLPYPRPTWRQSATRAVGIGALVLLIAWAMRGTEFSLQKLQDSLPRMADFFGRLFPPDLDATTTSTVFDLTVETFQIALVGTFISVLASALLGLLAATNLSPAWVYQPTRWLLGLMRGIPSILLGLMFVTFVGLGPFPGVLAIAFHSTGMLAKFYAEAIENARRGPLEALDSAGASWWQRIRFGILPQVIPDLVRDTVFRFELNFRDSSILGLVGAGGIGIYIWQFTRNFKLDRVATATIVVVLMVIAFEQISVAVRSRLR